MRRSHLSRGQLAERLAALRADGAEAPGEAAQLLHELELHQLELQIQNQDLQSTHRALSASRDRYAELYDLAPVPYFTFDTHGVVREANRAAEALLGVPYERMVGVPFVALVQALDTARFLHHLRRCTERRARVSDELGFRLPSGSRVDVLAVSTLVPAADDASLRVLTTFTEVSRRATLDGVGAPAGVQHRATFAGVDRAAVGVARALASLTVGGTPMLMQVIADQVRVLLDAEVAGVGICGAGAEADDWVYSHAEGVPPGCPDANALRAVMRGGADLDLRALRADPDLLAVLSAHGPVRGVVGQPVSFAGRCLGFVYVVNKVGGITFTDADVDALSLLAEHIGNALEVATLHERAARDVGRLRLLAQAVDLLASVTDAHALRRELARVPIPWLADCAMVVLAQPDGPRVGGVAHVDGALEESMVALVEHAPECLDAPGSALAEAWATGRAVLRTSDIGAVYPLSPDMPAPGSVLVVPLLRRGEVIGALVLAYCISGRRHDPRDVPIAREIAHRCALALENARLYGEVRDAVAARDVQLQAARDALAARDAVLRVVAHDLRSPLAGIRLLSNAMYRRAAEVDRTERHPMAMLCRTVDKMDALIRDLLDVARLDGGGLVVEHAAVGVPSVLSESVQAHAPAAAQHGVELEAASGVAVPDVLGDRGRIVQALDNLIGNALKFTPPGGRVTVGARMDGAEHVELWVQDTGPGIAADHIPHLFERYWQASRADTRGAGLGLSIVKGIADAHEGRVWVDSTVGLGSTFHLSLPVARVDSPPMNALVHAILGGAGE